MIDHIPPECPYGPEFCNHDEMWASILAALEEAVDAE